MKAIQLHTAALDNSGARHDSGTILTIGTGKEQIAAERARALVERGGAAVAQVQSDKAVA